MFSPGDGENHCLGGLYELSSSAGRFRRILLPALENPPWSNKICPKSMEAKETLQIFIFTVNAGSIDS